MHKILAILRREYMQSIKTKMFWIGTLAFPLFFVGIMALSIGAQLINPESEKQLAILDVTGEFGKRIAEGLAEHKLKDDTPEFVVELVDVAGDLDRAREELAPQILDGSLYGIVTVGSDIEAEDNYGLYRKSVGDSDTSRTIRNAITDAAINIRLERSALDVGREELEALVQSVRLESFQITKEATRKKHFGEEMIATFGFVIILFFTLYFYGFAITRGIIQEKSNRVIEVLLGSLSSDQLITGKILGIGLVGLTQMAIYTLVGGSARIAAAIWLAQDNSLGTALSHALSAPKLIYFLIFFVLGYFLFSSLFAMIGAVCNTEQDAQSLQFPVMMCLMVPYLTTFFFVKHPDSMASVIASFIPLFTPMVMFMRISVLTPPFWQIALSIVIMLGAIYVMFRVAAKVFRIGTLMYGKRPSLTEIVRWARS